MDLREDAITRAPAVDKILQNQPHLDRKHPEIRLLKAYDVLVNYAKAMALGDECQNPLDRGESRR